MKRFNTVGQCIPKLHYMVNIEDKLEKIKKLVDDGYYFVINRARQYGKTTTLNALAEYLREEYVVISLDFQRMSQTQFSNEEIFCESFVKLFFHVIENKKHKAEGLNKECLNELASVLEHGKLKNLGQLFVYLSNLCDTAEKPVVLMIDEVDSASNNQVFLDFLAQLRSYYLDRDNVAAFYSVILAGVYDIKNLKLKMRPEAEHQYNSPWNIAEPFNVDMSFSASEIAGMLEDYEQDHHTGMNINEVSQCIYEYTSGYPFLVSSICKKMDSENLKSKWSREGVAEAVKILVKEQTTLFDSLNKQLDTYKDLREMLKKILFQGNRFSYNPYNEVISLGVMFGYLKERGGSVVVSNRVFEIWIYNLFLSEDELQNVTYRAAQKAKNQFVQNGRLNMDHVLEKFVEHYTDVYSQSDQDFVERQGRKLFLLYLKPIINGVGNYYVEAETRDMERTDIIVDYLGEQFIIELKIWHGEKYNARGEEQLAGYLDQYHVKKGYLLTFSFSQKKEAGVRTVSLGDKVIVEAVV